MCEGFAATNRGDYDRQFLQYAPQVEILIEDPDWWVVDVERVRQGLDGARKFMDDLKLPFERIRGEPREVLDAGSGRGGCRLDFVGVGRASGAEARHEQWHVYLIEQGAILRQTVLSTEDEAVATLAGAPENLTGKAVSNQP